MTFANLLVYCKDAKPAGLGIECGPGDFGALVQKLRRERGLI